MRWLKWIAVAAMFAVGFGAVFVSYDGLGGTQAATTELLTQPARLTTVARTSAATGTVASAGTYSLAFGEDARVAGETGTNAADDSDWTVTDILVGVGDRVSAAQVLATVTTTDIEADITDTSADLELARMRLAEAEQALADARRAAKRALVDAKTAVDAAEIAVNAAKVDRSNAESGNPTRLAKIALIGAQDQLRAAKRLRDDLKDELKGDFPEQQIVLTEATLAVGDLETQLAELTESRELATLVAPIDGVVTAVNIDEGFIAPSSGAVEIESASLEVVADVVESDVSALAVGQTAQVTIDALDLDVAGTVTSIAPSTDGGTSSVVTFPVTVSLDAPDERIKAGMSADVEITIAEAAGVVAVPAVALQGRNGDYTVRVVGSGGAELRPVSVGLVTETLAEIQSGIAEGEAVVVGSASDRVRSADEAAVGPGGFGGGDFRSIRGLQGGGGGRGGRD